MKNQLRLFDNQVSGKTPKFTNKTNTQIYKQLSKREYHFYTFMNNLQIHEGEYNLRKYIPKFLGKKYLQNLEVVAEKGDGQGEKDKEKEGTSKKGEWINHIYQRLRKEEGCLEKEYIALENLGIGYRYPCVMDIKLGKKKVEKSSNKKFENSTTNSHNFRINGMSNLYPCQQNPQPHFISKYYFQKTSQDQIETHLAFFFFNGQQIDKKLVQNCVEIIKQIVLSLACFRAGNFDSASLLIMYDAYQHGKFTVRVIDFDKYYEDSRGNQGGDQNVIVGLKYIIWYLNNVVQQHHMHEEVLKARKIKLFDNFEVVPQEKKNEFTPKTQKQKSSQTSSPKKDSLSDLSPLLVEVPDLELMEKSS